MVLVTAKANANCDHMAAWHRQQTARTRGPHHTHCPFHFRASICNSPTTKLKNRILFDVIPYSVINQNLLFVIEFGAMTRVAAIATIAIDSTHS